MQVLRYTGGHAEVSVVDVPDSVFAGASRQPPHSPVLIVECTPPTSVTDMRARGTVSLPPGLCCMLLCPPLLIASASGHPLTALQWQAWWKEAEAARQLQVVHQERTVVSQPSRAVVDEVVRRQKRAPAEPVASKKVKVKEDVEVSEDELQDDAVVDSSSEEDEEEDVAAEDEEEVGVDDDACESGECEEDEEVSGEEECEDEDDCGSEGAEGGDVPPPKKLRGAA